MQQQPVITGRVGTRTTTYEGFVEKVRYEGAYPTYEQADAVVRAVLAQLGRMVTGDERVALAARLPREAAAVLAAQIPTHEPLTGWGFVKDLASRTGRSPAVTRWDTGAVLSTVALLTGPELLSRILTALPAGYGVLFGRAELPRPRTESAVLTPAA